MMPATYCLGKTSQTDCSPEPIGNGSQVTKADCCSSFFRAKESAYKLLPALRRTHFLLSRDVLDRKS